MQVGRCQIVRPTVVAAIDPACVQASVGSPLHIHVWMIAYVQDVLWGDAQPAAGFVKEARVGFGRAIFAGTELKSKQTGNTNHR